VADRTVTGVAVNCDDSLYGFAVIGVNVDFAFWATTESLTSVTDCILFPVWQRKRRFDAGRFECIPRALEPVTRADFDDFHESIGPAILE
jgi:hypothetical protein